jgi:membrane associated rhomboid family serine protease
MYRATPVVGALLIINVVVFVMTHLVTTVPWFELFGLVPTLVIKRFMFWQVGTYMFLHSGIMHITLNMLMLWFFGPGIESAWGRRDFLRYYFITGIGAALCSILAAFGSATPIVGASGAIFGILVAYAMIYPETVILIFFFFPMRIKHAVLLLAGINLFGALSSPGSDIAYVAHLGGGLCGYLYLKYETLGFSFRRSGMRWLKKGIGAFLLPRKRERNTLEDIDRILDKIAEHGIESLSYEERRTLERKSRKYNPGRK